MSVGPDILARASEAPETKHGLVDGAISASVDEEIVEESTEQAAEERRDHGDPEVVTTERPDLRTVANHVGNETRAKVTGEVDSVTSLPAEASTDTEDEEEETEGHHLAGTNVVVVGHGVDAHHEDSRGDDLGEEHASTSHELGRVRAEDASGGSLAANSSDTSAALKHVDGRLVVSVDNGSTGHGAEDLSNGVDGELAPRVATEDAVGEGNSRVDVTAALSRDVDTEHDTDSVRDLSVLLFIVQIAF